MQKQIAYCTSDSCFYFGAAACFSHFQPSIQYCKVRLKMHYKYLHCVGSHIFTILPYKIVKKWKSWL